MSHVPQEIEPPPSTTEVVFRISDGSGQRINDVRISQPDLLRRWSLGLSKLMDEEGTSQQIPLKLDPTSGIDSAAVEWVLENLQRQALAIRPDPETLARHCAVLWKYECNPDPFKNFGESLQPRSSSGSPSIDQKSSIAPSASPSGGSRCWGGKKNSITCGQLITIAIVLGLQEILEEEIRIAVWGTNKKLRIAVPLATDIEVIRREELGKLFEKVYTEIIDINDDNEKLGNSIRETLKQHNLGNFAKSWKKNSKELEKWTPYDFLRGVENALTPEPQTQAHEPRAQVPTRAKDVPRVNWPNLINKTTKAVKDAFHIIDDEEVGGNREKEGILESLEELIEERHHALAAELMMQRHSIVKAWKDQLDELNRLKYE